MVDKVDRPEAPRPYRINEAPQTKGNQPQGGNQQQEESEAPYKKEEGQKEWGKFHLSQLTIKPIRAARRKIRACHFRHTTIRQGIPLLVADLTWENGQTTEGAHFILRRHEDFLKLKVFRPGQDVPEEFWASGDEVEIGIPEMHGTSGKFRMPMADQEQKKAPLAKTFPPWVISLGLIDAVSGHWRWGFIFGFLFAMTIAILVIIQVI